MTGQIRETGAAMGLAIAVRVAANLKANASARVIRVSAATISTASVDIKTAAHRIVRQRATRRPCTRKNGRSIAGLTIRRLGRRLGRRLSGRAGRRAGHRTSQPTDKLSRAASIRVTVIMVTVTVMDIMVMRIRPCRSVRIAKGKRRAAMLSARVNTLL